MTPHEAHKSGLPLKESLDKFGNWRKFNLDQYGPSHPMPENWENDPDIIKNNPEAITNAVLNFNEAVFAPGKRNHAVAEDFKLQLANEKLLGIGYLSPRNIADDPQLIPADIWQLGKINFSKSEVENGSLKFESVRIIKLGKNKEITENKHSTNIDQLVSVSPKPVGRPSSRDKIIKGYEELKGGGKIDYSKPMSHAYPIIRSLLFFRYKTEKGFKDEAIRLAIKDDFHEMVEKQNPAQKL